VRIVSPDELEAVWPRVLPWIESALEYGQGDEEAVDIAIAIHNGRYDLWLHDKFAAVVQVVRHPRQTVATILYCGGELEALQWMYVEAKNYARENGINVIRVWGREGWKKVLKMRQVGVILQEMV
jgi:hypothetical protein